MATTVNSLLNTSADDCKISLAFVTDVALLRQALAAAEERGEKTKTKHIAHRIKQLGGATLADFKPCPFCGGKHLYWDSMAIDSEELHFLVCKECGCEGPTSVLRQVAGLLWETRQPI